VSFALWFQAAGSPHLIDTIAFPRASHSRQQPGPALFVSHLYGLKEEISGLSAVVPRCPMIRGRCRRLIEPVSSALLTAPPCWWAMEVLGFLVVLLAFAATAGVAWLHFGQHTRVELTRSARILAPSNPRTRNGRGWL